MKCLTDLENDLLERLTREGAGRRILRVEGARWGHLILPAPDETAKRPVLSLRVLCIGSWTLGLLALESLLSLETREADGLTVVGLVTDDPLDVDAKISIKKRFWQYYDEPEREKYEWAVLHRALPIGIPCYTGEVKSAAFMKLLNDWAPEAIVVAAFGQVIDQAIIDFPAYGIYNVHPSDLLHGHGAGPQPWEDLVQRKAFSTRVTLHRVSPTIDDGDIVGQSPDINVRLPDGSASNDVRMIGEKTLVPVAPMVRELANALVKKKASGLKGPLDALDFERIFGSGFKARLMEPLDPNRRGHILPLPMDEEQYTV
jgi:folate-dependent phosphoribosylglycinamide formyltransferase PurN